MTGFSRSGRASSSLALALAQELAQPMQVGGQHRQRDGPREPVGAAAAHAVQTAMLKRIEKWTPDLGQPLKWNLPSRSGCHFWGRPIIVHRIRGASAQRAMTTPGVVELEVPGQPGS